MIKPDEKQAATVNTLPHTDVSELFKKPYLNELEVAALTGRSVHTLRNERHLRRGIPYLKISARSIRYLLQDVQAAMEARRITFDEVAR